MPFACIQDLAAHLGAAGQVPNLTIAPDICPPDHAGDITVNCFHLARDLRRNPLQLAATATEFLAAHADVATVDCIKAFVNVTLTDAALFRDACAAPADRRLPAAERRRILVEYSAPNTNKPQHLGHVRNNSLGTAICGLLERLGHDVVPINLVNDRGIHICKSMLAYQRFGNGETPATAGRKGDHLVGDYYVRYDQELRRQVTDLRAARPELADKTNDELFLETEIGRAAQEMLRAWEAGAPAVRQLWQTMNEWVLAGFAETYARLGVHFVHTYFESQTYGLGKDLVQQGLDQGVFYRRADGAIEIDLGKTLGNKVVLRSDGTSVYVTQDLGTTLLKYRDYEPDAMIWIVGDEQIYHFQVLFAILERLGYDWAKRCEHLAYGMVNLPEGKMKSREGTVVDADDLCDEVSRLAREETLERCGDDVPADLDERAEAIGIGAIKFMLLKVNPKTTMTFDPKASVKFEGDTGPYVQYAYARISSILRKAAADPVAADLDWSLLGEPEERAVALLLAEYGNALRKAAANLDSSVVASYLLDLTRAFSRFYKQHSVLSAPTPGLIRTRLELCERVRETIGDGLHALGIGTLENM